MMRRETLVSFVVFSLIAVTARAAIPWPGTPNPQGYPSDPASRIHHWKEEAIIGNQFISVMLDQNGTVYDIYYPSTGFRNGSGTANEGYKGPEEFIGGPFGCSTDLQANGQMNVIAAMGGIDVAGNIYWMKNHGSGPGPVGYDNISQAYLKDNNVVLTSNRLNVANNQFQVVQYDFCPSTNAIPPVAVGGGRTNYGVYVKRYLLTNLQNEPRTIRFYFDANFNVKGENAGDFMYMDYGHVVPALGPGQTNHTMVVVDGNNTLATGSGCTPNGYGDLGDPSRQYNPKTTASYNKTATVTFGVCMKLVTNSLTGAGTAFDGSWRDFTATDHQEGWIGKEIAFGPNETREVDIMIVGSWDDLPGQTGVHDFWGRPLVNWFYAANLAAVQAATEQYWSDWLAQGVRVDLPGTAYDDLFTRSKLVTALHIDAATGAIIAGMHNGAYPFCWPRDGVYAAITLDRIGYPAEAQNFYRWLRDIAYRAPDCNPGGKSFFFQKYTTDGYFAWNSPQIDETASVPWGIWYHYLSTGDLGFLTNFAGLVRETAYASFYDSCADGRANYNDTFKLMDGNNIWEDSFGLFLYSNASVVRGLRDAVHIANKVPGLFSPGDTPLWSLVADETRDTGIVGRVNARVEPADISHLGLSYPFEVFAPTNNVMLAIVEWIHGNGAPAGGFNDNLVETGGGNAGYLRRYNHNINSAIDNYWNGGPWHLSTSWYGMYHAQWQNYAAGKVLVDVNLDMLDKIIARLGPVGLGAEQIAPDYAQKYPGFWHQAAWPNVWESHSTFLDQIMMFLDYKPTGTNANSCSLAPKLPTGWNSMTFHNLRSQGQRFDITVSETNQTTRADVAKLTTGPLAYEIWLRIPPTETPALVLTNGLRVTSFTYDPTARRVGITGNFRDTPGADTILVTFGLSDVDGDGLTDANEINLHNTDPLDDDSDNDGMPDGFEVTYGLNPNADDTADDLDGDGQTNIGEYLAGTLPNNTDSALRVIQIERLINGHVLITWQSVPGKFYRVKSTDDLNVPFGNLSPVIEAIATTTSYPDPAPPTNRFYKVYLVTP